MEELITITKTQLIEIFAEWNKEYIEEEEVPTLNDYLDPILPIKQADDLFNRFYEKFKK